jgi:ribosomal protein L11 methylase PrmA
MNKKIEASFRDPAGFLYRSNGTLLRHVNQAYADDYDACKSTGLYNQLISEGLLIPHVETDEVGMSPDMYCILMPEELPYVSYPYEWSFSQLKDAALLTLEVQRIALEHDLSLKDATAYNVQFRDSRAIFIDTLSFERYVDGKPWVAYRQFCQHFLAPLTLMAAGDLRLRQLTFRYLDGLPLDLVSKMLPRRSWLTYSILAHIHMHARSQRKHQDDARTGERVAAARLPKAMLAALIHSLKSAVHRLSARDVSTEWGEYYNDTNYSRQAMRHKEELLESFAATYLSQNPVVHDLGANTGRFSRIVAAHCKDVIAHDVDEMAVERHYRYNKENGSKNVLPLVLDLTNPSPPAGWELKERLSFHERANGAGAVALALVHHLCITNNVPLDRLAGFFGDLFQTLIIEFVPKQDSQVQRMLATRRDVFDSYDVNSFEKAFSERFEIKAQSAITDSYRILYAMTRREED